jgi:hypothetical protein
MTGGSTRLNRRRPFRVPVLESRIVMILLLAIPAYTAWVWGGFARPITA